MHTAEPRHDRSQGAGVWQTYVGSAVVTIGGFCLLGAVVGWLWSVLADPASYAVTADGAVMGEMQATLQFGVIVTFTWLSGAAALVWGAFTGWWYSRLEWTQVVLVVLGASAAAVIAWQLGEALGPPDPKTVIHAAKTGALVPAQLRLDAHGVLLIWPIAGLIAQMAAVGWLAPSTGDEDGRPR